MIRSDKRENEMHVDPQRTTAGSTENDSSNGRRPNGGDQIILQWAPRAQIRRGQSSASSLHSAGPRR